MAKQEEPDAEKAMTINNDEKVSPNNVPQPIQEPKQDDGEFPAEILENVDKQFDKSFYSSDLNVSENNIMDDLNKEEVISSLPPTIPPTKEQPRKFLQEDLSMTTTNPTTANQNHNDPVLDSLRKASSLSPREASLIGSNERIRPASFRAEKSNEKPDSSIKISSPTLKPIKISSTTDDNGLQQKIPASTTIMESSYENSKQPINYENSPDISSDKLLGKESSTSSQSHHSQQLVNDNKSGENQIRSQLDVKEANKPPMQQKPIQHPEINFEHDKAKLNLVNSPNSKEMPQNPPNPMNIASVDAIDMNFKPQSESSSEDPILVSKDSKENAEKKENYCFRDDCDDLKQPHEQSEPKSAAIPEAITVNFNVYKLIFLLSL